MDITDLDQLNKQALHQEWIRLFRTPAPDAHESFLRQAIGYQIQANQIGGLNSVDKQYLKSNQASNLSKVSVGTRLVRVWQEETHQVTVLADGYLYQEMKWRSLSAIAKSITGTPWSGPAFFGLKNV